MKKITLLSLSFVLFFSFVAINNYVVAEENGEVSVVEETTTADLGVENPGLLPSNPFYFLKEWGRGIRMLLTFNPVSKIEYELEVVNNKAAEFKKIEELDKDTEVLEKALNNYNENVERLRVRLESLKETSQNPNIDELLDKVAEKTIQHQQLFGELKEKHEVLKDKLDNVQDNINEVVLELPKKFDDPEKFRERIEKAVQTQKESVKKEVSAINFINRLEENIDSTEVLEDLGKFKEEQVLNIEAKLKSGIIQTNEIGSLVEDVIEDNEDALKVLEKIEGNITDSATKVNLEETRKRISEKVRKMGVESTDNSGPVEFKAVQEMQELNTLKPSLDILEK